jgi:hypothetical protein
LTGDPATDKEHGWQLKWSCRGRGRVTDAGVTYAGTCCRRQDTDRGGSQVRIAGSVEIDWPASQVWASWPTQ